MIYICKFCKKPIDEKDTVMVPYSSGFGGGWTEPACIICYNERAKDEYKIKLEPWT